MVLHESEGECPASHSQACEWTYSSEPKLATRQQMTDACWLGNRCLPVLDGRRICGGTDHAAQRTSDGRSHPPPVCIPARPFLLQQEGVQNLLIITATTAPGRERVCVRV